MRRKRKTIWFVVADSARANVYAVESLTVGMQPVNFPLAAGAAPRTRARDLVSDRPGRSFSSAGGPRHAYEPQHDYHKIEKHNFLAGLARALEDALDDGKYDALVLVAPKRSLGELRTLLSKPALAHIGDELPKDLTKHSADALWTHLSPIAKHLLRAVD